jgi:AHBA synthesis associated protein
MLVSSDPGSGERHEATAALRRVQAVVFDLDGVLVDSWPLMRRVFATACAACGAAGDLERFRALLGRPLPQIAQALGLGGDFVAAYERLASERVGELRLYTGVQAELATLRARGYRLAVNTGKGRWRSLQLLARLGLAERFGCLVSGDDVVHGKPDPESLLLVGAQLGVAPERMAFVGDMAVDVLCARAAGAVAVGVAWGVGTPEELRQARPALMLDVVSRMSDAFPGPQGG